MTTSRVYNQDHPSQNAPNNATLSESDCMVVLSASTQKALDQKIHHLINFIEQHPKSDLMQLPFDAGGYSINLCAQSPQALTSTQRSREKTCQNRYRLACAAHNSDHLRKKLMQKDYWVSRSDEIGSPSSSHSQLAFLFTGQGAQYTGMGAQLYQQSPIFRQAIDQCETYLESELDVPLKTLLFDESAQTKLNQTLYTQPCLFALEYALATLWQAWGVIPDYMMGHSVGELVAATVAGVMSLADGLRLISARARLMQALPEGGGMAAVLAPLDRVKSHLEAYRSQYSDAVIDIAGINGPNQTVISGTLSALQSVTPAFIQAGVKVKPLNVSHAFHSKLMEPMLDEFKCVADSIKYSSPQYSLVSNVTGDRIKAGQINADYWRSHVRQPVNFLGGMRYLFQAGCTVFLEVGPHPVLNGMGTRCVPVDLKEKAWLWLPSLRRKKADWPMLLDSLGQCHVNNV